MKKPSEEGNVRVEAIQLLEDIASRPADVAREVLTGISDDSLHHMPVGRHNSIAWSIWHAARQQDLQIAQLHGGDQVWTAQGWDRAFDVGRDAGDCGIGDGPDEVAALRVRDPDLLQGYLEATAAATVDYLKGLTGEQLDEIVDRSWEPHVSRGVRIVSTLDDTTLHLGQAAYVRGMLGQGWKPYM